MGDAVRRNGRSNSGDLFRGTGAFRKEEISELVSKLYSDCQLNEVISRLLFNLQTLLYSTNYLTSASRVTMDIAAINCQ